MFEQCSCCWTIFSHQGLEFVACIKLKLKAAETPPPPLSLYGTHLSLAVRRICCFPSLLFSVSLPIPVFFFFFCRSTSFMWIRGSLRVLPTGLLVHHWVFTHPPAQHFASGTEQDSVIRQQLDLLKQTELCPYIGSSIGKKLEAGGKEEESC